MSLSPLHFSFKGVECDQHGVEVLRLPALVRPALREEQITIPGRSGLLRVRDGAYEPSLGTCDCYLPYEQHRPVSDIERISAWLTGSGWWAQSDRPYRKFRASIVDELTYQPVVPGFEDRIFSVSVWLEPFAYHVDSADVELTSAGTVTNPGTAEAEPIITITGSGDISLTVGSRTVLIAGLTGGSITLDCEARMAYRSSTNLCGIVTLSQGTWPILPPGSTQISWTGSVTKVKITPNWRDI